MGKDEREEELDFLEGLKARTGRDLAEWMAAITARGFSDKNEIIDWLRTQGLPFPRAAWLDRIHRNGGKPIQIGVLAAVAPEPGRDAERRTEPPRRPVLRIVPGSRGQTAPQVSEEEKGQSPADAAAAFEKLVAAAKGYRPLYHLLEAQIR